MPEKSPELIVRIEELAPMRVAWVKVVSDTPESDAWEKLSTWAGAKDLLGDVENHPVYGFNNPGPSPGHSEYGYEFWIRVDRDTEADGEIGVKEFAGGVYAVTTHAGLPNPDVWMDLWNWVQSSSYTWRKTHELERPLDPLAAAEDATFDLLLPIEI